jgi:hypothetical protein
MIVMILPSRMFENVYLIFIWIDFVIFVHIKHVAPYVHCTVYTLILLFVNTWELWRRHIDDVCRQFNLYIVFNGETVSWGKNNATNNNEIKILASLDIGRTLLVYMYKPIVCIMYRKMFLLYVHLYRFFLVIFIINSVEQMFIVLIIHESCWLPLLYYDE